MSSRTTAVANWVASTSYSEFPEETTTFAKALLLKTITGMVAGSREPIAKILNTYYAEQGGAPEAGVVAGGFRTDRRACGYCNATFAHASELEDNEMPSITAPTGCFPRCSPWPKSWSRPAGS